MCSKETIEKINEILAPFLPYRNATKDDGYQQLDNALEYYYSHYPDLYFSSKKCPICGFLMGTEKHKVNSFKEIRKTVGGHIFCRKDNKVYILPICEQCNHREGWFKLKSDEGYLLPAP